MWASEFACVYISFPSHAQVCGTASKVCVPTFDVQANWGGVVAQFSAAPPPAGKTCQLANGTLVPCTSDCHTVADGAPLWTLTDPSNSATGGITMQLQGLTVNADEPSAVQCRWDPNGDAIAMDFKLVIACDPATPSLVVTGPVAVAAGCHYTINAKSAVVCGM